MHNPKPNALRWLFDHELAGIETTFNTFIENTFQPTPDDTCHIILRRLAPHIPHSVELHCIRDTSGDWQIFADAMLIAVIYTDIESAEVKLWWPDAIEQTMFHRKEQ